MTRLSSIGEFGLINGIRRACPSSDPFVLRGIGDDAAIVKIKTGASLLAATDMLLEGVHFDLAYTDYYSLGWKSIAVNLSDIAAMGGIPRFVMISLGIPATTSVQHLKEFYRGCRAMLKRHAVSLIGGDTCSSKSGFTVNVAVLGEGVGKKIITRSGARPGDRIYVTGALGDSAAGLELLQSGIDSGRGRIVERRPPGRSLMQRHLRPIPRVDWGGALAKSGCAGAMIDISDGLSSDLAHICDESGVGARISASALPISPALRRHAMRAGRPVRDYAVSGGEDYELLFTTPCGKIAKLHALGLPITEIGEITSERRILIEDGGAKSALRPTGFNHFPE